MQHYTSSLASALALSGANTDARQVLAGASKELVNDASSWIVLDEYGQ